MNHRKNAIVIVLLCTICLFLTGCQTTGNPESLNTAEGGLRIYRLDVNGGKTPEAAEALAEALTSEYETVLVDLYTTANAGEDLTPEQIQAVAEKRASFSIRIRSMTTSKKFYDSGVDFFRAAIRYEESLLKDR